MNIIPTLEGGLRIDLEEPADWLLLRHLIDDACDRSQSLADALGERVTNAEVIEDWREFVIPDLQEQFATSLEKIREVMADAIETCENGTGSLWITPELGFDWYSSLNQARLAIETRHRFGDTSVNQLDPDANPRRQSAYYRSQFYSALQSLLLEHVLN